MEEVKLREKEENLLSEFFRMLKVKLQICTTFPPFSHLSSKQQDYFYGNYSLLALTISDLAPLAPLIIIRNEFPQSLKLEQRWIASSGLWVEFQKEFAFHQFQFQENDKNGNFAGNCEKLQGKPAGKSSDFLLIAFEFKLMNSNFQIYCFVLQPCGS